MYRTNYCGEVNENLIGKKVVVSGWVNSRRDHGGVVFFDLRDITGLVQIVFRPEDFENSDEILEVIKHNVKPEFVLKIEGKVFERMKGTENSNMSTGKIEIVLENRC